PVSDEKRTAVLGKVAEMKQNFSVIASSVKSMFSIANMLHGNFGDTQYASQIQQQLKDRLRAVDLPKVDASTGNSGSNN
ncbi:MAG: hypothetical protein ACRDGA_13935, partial [Bacteroidota bacterium]